MGSTIAEHLHNNEFIVADNFLEQERYDYIKSVLYSEQFPWNFIDDTSGVNAEATINSYGFACSMYDSELDLPPPYADIQTCIDYLVDSLSKDFDLKQILRVRAGLQLPVPSGTSYILGPHIDMNIVHYTALFYFCKETGGTGTTILYKENENLYLHPYYMYKNKKHEDLTVEQEVEPRENRVLIFRGNRYHSATQPVKLNRRIAVNVNFMGWPKVPEMEQELNEQFV